MAPEPESTPLFPPSLLVPVPADDIDDDDTPTNKSLPPGFTLRPLQKDDYARGYLDCLRVLTWVGDLSEREWAARYDDMARAEGTYYLLALEHEGRVVGTGSLVVERKFIHNRGLVGHIEEIAIDKQHQGKGLGLQMLHALDAIATNLGCYKNILNCGPQNEPFYVKCGYHNSGTEMSRYFDQAKDNYHRG